MRVLLDACVWGGARDALRAAGHEVERFGDWSADPGDENVLAHATATLAWNPWRKRPAAGAPIRGPRRPAPLQLGSRLGVSGVVVVAVDPGTGAALAWLQGTARAADGPLMLGDIIQAIDGDDVSDVDDLQTVLERYNPNDEVPVTILRDGQRREVRVQLF